MVELVDVVRDEGIVDGNVVVVVGVVVTTDGPFVKGPFGAKPSTTERTPNNDKARDKRTFFMMMRMMVVLVTTFCFVLRCKCLTIV